MSSASSIDFREFYLSTEPGQTGLNLSDARQAKWYVDFAAVRGGAVIRRMFNRISLKGDSPTCTLFTGHVGCGKSTELQQLVERLEGAGFHVVYFSVDEDLDMGDVDVGDVLLSIARQLGETLDGLELEEPKGFRRLVDEAKQLLTTEIDLKGATLGPPKGPQLKADESGKVSVNLMVAELMLQVRHSPRLREQLHQCLGTRTGDLLRAINEELIEPAIAKLKAKGKKGLVVVADNLEKMDNLAMSTGRNQQEYLFIDRGRSLSQLNCHMVFTMPLRLLFVDSSNQISQVFGGRDPEVLPMVPVRYRDGRVHEEGMRLLRLLVLRRAFPEFDDMADDATWDAHVRQIVAEPESLDRLCAVSGGHPRELLALLNEWLNEEMGLPLSQKSLERVIRAKQNKRKRALNEEEWALLRKVSAEQDVNDEDNYDRLIQSRFVFEYIEDDESWFEVNPLLLEAPEMQA
ncbi:MAG: ATP-binding protein [Cyanophyceae cyanobacterium]